MEKEKAGKYDKIVRTGLLLLLLAAFGFALRGGARMASSERVLTEKAGKEKPCVVIDAGHGGADPGKVGVDGSLEKDINLQIAKKLALFLTAADVDVALTRETDAGLYEEKKPALTVSIHQNSYHEEYVHGAQVFYYEGSQESRKIAERMQQVLAEQIDPDNARQAKANGSYYLLKKTSTPIIIIECGFLSNYEEAQKLSSEAYQEKTAWAIHLAILQYLNAEK